MNTQSSNYQASVKTSIANNRVVSVQETAALTLFGILPTQLLKNFSLESNQTDFQVQLVVYKNQLLFLTY